MPRTFPYRLPLVDGCLIGDNSGWIEGLSTCPRALEYGQLHKRILNAKRSPLNFGSAMHNALEYRYSRYTNRPIDDKYYNDISSILDDFFIENPTDAGDYRNLNWALELTRKYNARYAVEEFSLLQATTDRPCPHCNGRGSIDYTDPDGVDRVKDCLWCDCAGKVRTLVELPFSVDLYGHPMTAHNAWQLVDAGLITEHDYKHIVANGGIRVIFSGKIDLPVIIDGKVYVLDHKTTSMLGESFWQERKMSMQQKGYAWAFHQATGIMPHGYIINALRTKEAPLYVQNGGEFKGKTKTNNPESWWAETFARQRFFLHSGELDEWRTDAIEMFEEFFFHLERERFPKKTVWCCGKYGTCQFYDVCSTYPESDRLTVLSSGSFTDNNWSPLHV